MDLASSTIFNFLDIFDSLELLKVHPAIALLDNVYQFFKAGFWENEESVWDQVKEQVLKEIVSGITDYHKAVLNVDIKTMDGKIKDLEHVKKFTPAKFKDELLQTSKYLFDQRFKFDPTHFDQSLNYDPTIIASLTKLAAYYFTVSRVIGNETIEEGEKDLEETRQIIFWKNITNSALATYHWALNKRETLIKGSKQVLNYCSEDGPTDTISCNTSITFQTKSSTCLKVHTGAYAGK